MENKFTQDMKKLFNQLWNRIPKKWKPIIIVTILIVGVATYLLISRNLNLYSNSSIKSSVNIGGKYIEHLTINNYYFTSDGKLITQATGRDAVTGDTVSINFASEPTVAIILSEKSETKGK